MTTEGEMQAAMHVERLRAPGSLAPRILPWCGLVLWAVSVPVVVVFGQLLLPHALTEAPSVQQTAGGVVAGSVILGVLLGLHVAYWWRVTRHVRAELRLRRDVMESFDARLGLLRGLDATRPRVVTAGLWPMQLMALGATAVLIGVIGLGAATNALVSPGGSVDSPLLAYLFLGVCLFPFALAMTATGYSRMRLARLRVEVEMLGR